MSLLHAPLAIALSTSLVLPSSVVVLAPPPTPPGGAPAAGAGSLGDPATMSDAEKVDAAKALYSEGDAAFQAQDWPTALMKFEEAYNVYAPSFHVFNVNIGFAAYELGDCVKAKTAFGRFLDLVDEHPSRKDAQEKLIEIERSGCATTAPAVDPNATAVGTAPADDPGDDAPILTSRRSEREEAIDREKKQRDSKKKSPLLISGAVLTALGGVGIIGGAISLGLANRKANDLAELASPGPTGFPEGDYGDDEVFNLDRNRLPANNNATIALFVIGGALAVTGATLLIVDARRRKQAGGKAGDKNAKTKPRPVASVAPVMLPRGGGAAAALRF